MKIGSRILVVDDNADFRKILKIVLEGKGYVVEEAGDGQQALDLMGARSFHMAIVDLDMPRMNGLEFSKRVKAQDPKFPIMMITAYAQFYTPGEILGSGVDAFLQKPVDFVTRKPLVKITTPLCLIVFTCDLCHVRPVSAHARCHFSRLRADTHHIFICEL